jgi:hypothetical protein
MEVLMLIIGVPLVVFLGIALVCVFIILRQE